MTSNAQHPGSTHQAEKPPNPHRGITHQATSRRFPKGAWVVRYRDANNATLRRAFHTKLEALDFQAAVRTDKSRGDFINPRKAATPFREVAADWFAASEKRRKPKTVAGYRSILDAHLLPEFGYRPIGRISTADIERFLGQLAVSSGTQRNVLNVLNPIFKHAIKAGMLKANPCALVDLPPVHRKEMLFLEPEQVQQLAQAITPTYRTLVLTAAYTGMRAGELAALRVRNLDLMRGRVHVKESLADVGGKLHFGVPKGRQSREIGLPRFLVDLLTIQTAGKSPDDLVFTGTNGAPLRHGNYYQRHFRPAVLSLVAEGRWPSELAGLRFHDLRHTAASILIDQGVHPKLIADRLGHKSISVTMDIYGHRFPSKEDAIAGTLDDVFAGRTPAETEATVTSLPKP